MPASEVAREGLRLLQERELVPDEVRRKVAVGLEQARRGELPDGEKVFDELDRMDEGSSSPATALR